MTTPENIHVRFSKVFSEYGRYELKEFPESTEYIRKDIHDKAITVTTTVILKVWAEERERCAKVAENYDEYVDGCKDAILIAKAIRNKT